MICKLLKTCTPWQHVVRLAEALKNTPDHRLDAVTAQPAAPLHRLQRMERNNDGSQHGALRTNFLHHAQREDGKAEVRQAPDLWELKQRQHS